MNERQSEYRLLSPAEIEEARERWKQRRKDWLSAILSKWGASEMPYGSPSGPDLAVVLVLREEESRKVQLVGYTQYAHMKGVVSQQVKYSMADGWEAVGLYDLINGQFQRDATAMPIYGLRHFTIDDDLAEKAD